MTIGKTFVARAEITIDASRSKVWDALTKPDLIKQYLVIQDNNATLEEASHSSQNWQIVLEGIKKLLERA